MATDESNVSVNLTRSAGLEGLHRFTVVEVETRQGPSGAYWNFTLEVNEGSEFDGKRVFLIVSHSTKARFKMDEFLDAVKAPSEGTAQGTDFLGSSFLAEAYTDSFTQTDEETGRKKMRYATKIDNLTPEDGDGVSFRPGGSRPAFESPEGLPIADKLPSDVKRKKGNKPF